MKKSTESWSTLYRNYRGKFDQLSYTTHTDDASDINNPSSMQCTSHLWPTMSSKSNFFFCTGLNFFSGLISPTA